MDEAVNERLEHARARAAEKAALDVRAATVRRQIADREASLATLDERLHGEEADVRCLEGRSLSAMFAAMLGRKEERLRAERADVLRAKLARDACASALDALRADEAHLSNRLAELADAEPRLAEARRAKEAALVARGDPAARRLAEIDALTADARAVSKEIAEATDAADAAIGALDRVSASLDSAGNWGTFDLLGGGTLATWAKHARIDDAREEAHRAQAALDRFSREIADVRGDAAKRPIVVEIGGFAKFADYFFDGLVSDWVVQQRISRSRENVASVRADVSRARDLLAAQLREIRSESDSLADERIRVIERT